ncbi:carbon storage regulator [Solibacillus silvestris StLB046]|uniref:Translational regulator CsrA n=1 Tax=Solibacillus silvestris (strain StLB046) TaxID=1002809 RepID=F2F317_SOLSS|nr:carbon storage regulator CsrA [Solibacillus silvestris]BAK17705.1 carbon storage regulator [Solibacillus silvestris StLB046]
MLVLTRKKGETIMIGDQIEVKVISVDGEQVKLGIVAPKSVKVHRSEVFEAIQQQNKEALATSIDALKQFKLKK